MSIAADLEANESGAHKASLSVQRHMAYYAVQHDWNRLNSVTMSKTQYTRPFCPSHTGLCCPPYHLYTFGRSRSGSFLLPSSTSCSPLSVASAASTTRSMAPTPDRNEGGMRHIINDSVSTRGMHGMACETASIHHLIHCLHNLCVIP